MLIGGAVIVLGVALLTLQRSSTDDVIG